ncbi:MAG: FHA domain-containing protein [Thermodesulfobacteriota bacterium]|jgi:predicted component of type VI protein secretion system
MLKFTVVSGPDAGRVFTVARETVTIGRGEDCEVTLHDSLVSRRHCSIQRQNGRFVIANLYAANGLFLNTPETRIETAILRNGDEVLCGRSRIRIEWPQPHEPQTAARKPRGNSTSLPSAEGSESSASPPPPIPLPSNWQEGMTVCVPRARALAPSDKHVRAASPPGRRGIVARLTASVQRLLAALKPGGARRSEV